MTGWNSGRTIWLSRRALLGRFGGAATTLLPGPLAVAGPAQTPLKGAGQEPAKETAKGQGDASARSTLKLLLKPATAALRDTQPPSPVWGFETTASPRLTQGDELELTLANDLPVPVALSWRGGGGSPVEPLAVRPPLLPGQSSSVSLPLRQAGTVLCDARLLGDAQARALPATAFTVLERERVAVDQDQTLLIEDWRLKPDGSAAAPGTDPGDTTALFTINGKSALDLAVRANERLRLRFINACQRALIAVRVDDHEVRVMAIDGQPAEPFVARNGQIVLAPGTRIDAFVDATGRPSSTSNIQLHDGTTPRPIGRLLYGSDAARGAPLAPPDPLPSNGLPDKLDLKAAVRIDLPLDIKPDLAGAPWLRPASLNAAAAPAFRIKRGRIAVLTLTNRAATPVVFCLHGHHMRLLDRLDDGWKPFWLDTLVVEPQQTQRVAFAAEHAGAWLVETMGTDWSAPRLARWYAVE